MSLSLIKSVRSCSVNTGNANKYESERFQNSDLAVCPLWNGKNNQGQRVRIDSFYTKSRGCNNALDIVQVETNLRPDYSAFYDMAGLSGEHNDDDHYPVDELGSATWPTLKGKQGEYCIKSLKHQ